MKLVNYARILLENARRALSYGCGIGLLSSTHRHTHARALDHDDDAIGFQFILDSICHLSRKTFLDLEPASIDVRDASQTEDIRPWERSRYMPSLQMAESDAHTSWQYRCF